MVAAHLQVRHLHEEARRERLADVDVVALVGEVRRLGYSVFFVIGAFFGPSGGFVRDLCLFMEDQAELRRLSAALAELPASFELTSISGNVALFRVTDPRFTRKRFAPQFLRLLKRS